MVDCSVLDPNDEAACFAAGADAGDLRGGSDEATTCIVDLGVILYTETGTRQSTRRLDDTRGLNTLSVIVFHEGACMDQSKRINLESSTLSNEMANCAECASPRRIVERKAGLIINVVVSSQKMEKRPTFLFPT